MATPIKIKRSATPAKAPSTSDLQLGELAINTYDGKLYTKKDNGTASIVEIGAGGGGGQVYTYSATAPSSPSAGDEWLDSGSGILYTYVNDGNSSAWVELGGPGVGPKGETGALAVGDRGDVTVDVSGNVTIDAQAVTYAKIQNVAGNTILGNSTSSSNTVSEISCTSAGRSLLAALDASGQLTTLGAAPLNSPALTGTPTAPTATAGDNSTQIATTAFVTTATNAARQGLTVKQSCRAGTTANITLSNTQTVDGVVLVAGDRVLVKDQSTGSQNGIYLVATGAWTRATDFDATSDVTDGAFTFIEEGTINADTGWVMTTDGSITIGTTSLAFTQFTGTAQITAGTGLTKTGSTISLATTGTAGTYRSVTTDSYGRVTAGTNIYSINLALS